MKTIVYVDGFNLYYGCVRGTPYRWLDLSKLLHILLPKDTILQINYYTALVSARPNDPNQPIRQQTYLRALKTISNLDIVYGHFLSHAVYMHLANPPATGNPYVQVIKTEEKGSDVNLATHLLRDGFMNNYELAVVVSNDSDLVEPIRIVTQELGHKVGILNPQKHPSKTLLKYAYFFKNIRKSVLKASLFPPTLKDANGTFNKPSGW